MLPFELQCKLAGLPEPKKEYRFAPPRRWKFDFCWPDPWVIDVFEWPLAWPIRGVAMEVEGGVFIAGRHSRGAGMVKDMEKYNTATLQGWRVLRVTPKQIADGSALTLVEKAIRG